MSSSSVRSRFGRAAFLGIAYGAGAMIVLGWFDNLHPFLRATLPIRAAVVTGIGVAVHGRWLRQDRGEVALFWTGLALVLLRLVFLGEVPVERAALNAISAGSLMLPLALLVAPARHRTRWTVITLALCVGSSAVAIIPLMPAGFVALTAYLVFLWAILMALDRHARSADEAWSMALSDALTGLPNRRAVQLQLERAVANGGAAALLIADLDEFKTLNDVEGHAAGDVALREVADALRGVVTEPSSVGRWGGEEFVLLLRDRDTADAPGIAERARAAVARASPVTTSIGMAHLTPEDDPFSWMHRADVALYRAKANGRDRVETDPAR